MALSPEQRLIATQQVEDAERLRLLLEEVIGLLSQPQTVPDLSQAFAPFIDATLELRTAIEELKNQARSVPIIEVPPAQAPNLEPLNDLIERVEKAVSEIPEKVRKNFGDMRISGGTKASVKLESITGQVVDPATEDTLQKLQQGVADMDTKFDYTDRPAGNTKPARIGLCEPGAADGTNHHISSFTYDSSDRPTKIAYSFGAWIP